MNFLKYSKGSFNNKKPCKFYLTTGNCRNGSKCTFSHDLNDAGASDIAALIQSNPDMAALIEGTPGMQKRMNEMIQAAHGHNTNPRAAAWQGVMDKAGKKVCGYFLQNRCQKGEQCTFSHDEAAKKAFLIQEKKNKKAQEDDTLPQTLLRSNSQRSDKAQGQNDRR